MNPRDDDQTDDADDTPDPTERKIVLRLSHAHDCVNDCGTSLHCEDTDRCRVRGAWTYPSCEDRIAELQAIALAKTLGKD